MQSKDEGRQIVVLSDGTADTAEQFVRAVLAQFEGHDVKIKRIPKIRTEEELKSALDPLPIPCLVVYTFARESFRKMAWAETRNRGLTGFDMLYPAVDVFAEYLHSNPTEQAGNLHSTEALNYFNRMEAIEFTVKHDDGMKLNDLAEADIILTGVSRTSKTPTSMYLAHKGYRTANVPLVYGIDPPESLVQAHQKGVPIFLLTLDSQHLSRIRKARFDRLGTSSTSGDMYLNLEKINEELKASRVLAQRHRWPVIDVTSKAVEETASEILLMLSRKE